LLRISDDGTHVGCLADGVVIFEATTGRRLARVPNAVHSFDLSPDGRLVAAWVKKSPPTLGVIETETGRETARLVDEKAAEIGEVRWSLRSDLVVTADRLHQHGEFRVWNVRSPRIAASFGVMPSDPGRMDFVARGRYLVFHHEPNKLIDLTTDPPTDVGEQLVPAPSYVNFAAHGSRFVVNRKLDWALHDATTAAVVCQGSKAAESGVTLSPHGDWLIHYGMGPTNWMPTPVRRLVDFLSGRSGPGWWIRVSEADTGRMLLTLTNALPVAVDSDRSAVITTRYLNLSNETLVELWALGWRWPPVWLWLLAIAGFGASLVLWRLPDASSKRR